MRMFIVQYWRQEFDFKKVKYFQHKFINEIFDREKIPTRDKTVILTAYDFQDNPIFCRKLGYVSNIFDFNWYDYDSVDLSSVYIDLDIAFTESDPNKSSYGAIDISHVKEISFENSVIENSEILFDSSSTVLNSVNMINFDFVHSKLIVNNADFVNVWVQMQNNYFFSSTFKISYANLKEFEIVGVKLIDSSIEFIRAILLDSFTLVKVESIKSTVSFESCKFEFSKIQEVQIDKLVLTLSEFYGKTRFSGKASHLNLDHTYFSQYVDFRNLIVEHSLSIYEINNKEIIILPSQNDKVQLKILLDNYQHTNEERVSQYKKIKQLANQDHDYPLEDYFYIWEKRMQRKGYNWLHRIIDKYFWDYCFGYGLEPIKIWKLLFKCFVFFTGLFCFIPNIIGSVSGSMPIHWFDKIYFSAVTFLTIGYGDLHPIGVGKIIAPIEGLAGLLLTGAFVAILLRKLIRK